MTKKPVECCCHPAQAQKPGLTPISCHAVLERSACAPFIEERRMECVNATSLRRKSGQVGHPALAWERETADPSTALRSGRDDKGEGGDFY
jgi:hypothetical protein